MTSALESATPARPYRHDASALTSGARRVWAAVSTLARPAADARLRNLQLDGMRVLLAFIAGTLLVATGAGAWAHREQQRAVDEGAQAALRFVDRRLAAIDLEIVQMSRQADLPTPLSACPEALVAALLQQSLQSNLVRRFDLAQVGTPLRCEPQGARRGEPLDATPPAGLSIVPGSALNARPVVMRPLPLGAVLQATLDPYALAMPRTELPPDLQRVPMRVVVQSPPAGALAIWDARPHPGASPAALTSVAWSGRDNIGVQTQLDQDDLDAAIRRHALAALAAGWLAFALLLAWVWSAALRRARLSHRLQRALRKRQFVPFVQPIVDLASGRCIGAEVLMRWRHPHRGVLAPAEFIEEAERSGLILGMSDLTMSLAAHQLSALAQAQPGLYFSFNVTPGQLRQPGFAQRLAQIFGPATVPRAQVMLELTEREFVDPAACAALGSLRADGWRVAIDDFGTGHSSLSTIEQLSVDRIKIDRAFVSTVDERTVSRPVLDAIIGLAHELRVPLVAEGVETRSQFDYLAARGVASAQGYLMARPMAVDEFVRWFGRQAAGGADTRGQLPEALQGLWQRLCAADGPVQRTRLHRLRPHRHCFVGSQAVDWIVREHRVGRAEAVRIGRRLLALGLIRHVCDEHDFEDRRLFYRLVPPATEQAAIGRVDAAGLRLALREDPRFPWRSHRRGLLRHNACASGRALVDWVVRRQGCSRPQATQCAAQLMAAGVLRHVFDDRPFRDDATLYRLG